MWAGSLKEVQQEASISLFPNTCISKLLTGHGSVILMSENNNMAFKKLIICKWLLSSVLYWFCLWLTFLSNISNLIDNLFLSIYHSSDLYLVEPISDFVLISWHCCVIELDELYTVQCRYNAVNFLENPHNRHPIARPWGRGMGCLLWF